MKNELLMFKRYQVDVRDIKCHLQRWGNESMFFLIEFFAHQIIFIV